MLFEFLILNNFRNFQFEKFFWHEKLNLLIGKNASGKTNILEALSILSGWGAFGKTKDLLNWNFSDKNNTLLSTFVKGEQSFLDFSAKAKISSQIFLKLDDKKTSCTDLRIAIPSIFFMTDSISLIDGSPSIRRAFIDKLCAIFFPTFARRLAQFKIISRNRSALLKQNKPVHITSLPFCQLGAWIMNSRRKIISHLSQLSQNQHYSLKIFPEIEQKFNNSTEIYLFNELQNLSQKERFALHPLAGPNFDNIEFFVNSKSASVALSRGQKRKFIVSLIINSGTLIKNILKKNPIIIFDDLFAELDSDARQFCLNEILNTGWQCFVTSPENYFPELSESENCRIFHIDKL